MAKVGGKVRYIGESRSDMTHGQTYEVCTVLSGLVGVYDDVGDENHIEDHHFVPATENDKKSEYDYANQAAKYGIKIVVLVGNDMVIFDGRK